MSLTGTKITLETKHGTRCAGLSSLELAELSGCRVLCLISQGWQHCPFTHKPLGSSSQDCVARLLAGHREPPTRAEELGALRWFLLL